MLPTKRKEKERKHKSLPHKMSDLSFSPTFFAANAPVTVCSTKSLVSIPHFPDDLRILPDISAKPRLPPPLSLLLPPPKTLLPPLLPSARHLLSSFQKIWNAFLPPRQKGSRFPLPPFPFPRFLPVRERTEFPKPKPFPPLLFPSFLSAHKPIRGGGENPSRRRFALFHICA